MLPFDKEFQTGEARITQVRLSVLLANHTLLSLTEENIMLGGFIRDTSTTVDGEFTIGAAVTGKLTVIIDNSEQAYSRYDFHGAVITASLGGQLTNGEYQLVQVGIYTVDEYFYDGSNITLTAYDNFHKFDKPCQDTAITFPQTVTQLVREACTVADVELANTSIPNGSYSVAKTPQQWDTMTWHDVIAYCAQIACCYTRILPDGKLYFAWYDTGVMNSDQLDGGTFDTTTTPYSDGAIADGGDFNYNESTSYEGGHFGDRDSIHVIGSLFDISVSTDDVLITGISVMLAVEDNINATDSTKDYTKKLGTDGYVIRVENNPLIETTANADAVCSYIYNYIVGMRFRPLNASIVENPSIEAGDAAVVVDRNNNTYICFISHVTYTSSAATAISCDSVPSMQNLKARYGETQKTRALAQRTFERAVLDADAAMQMIMSAYATTMGLYQYTEPDGQGGTIYIYGNNNTLASSDIRWKFSASALMVSSDYGRTWNSALSAEGIAVFQAVYAVKVVADNIVSGTLTVGGNNNQRGRIRVLDENGVLCGELDSTGASVTGILMSYSNANGYATRINHGRIYIFNSSNYTYETLKNLNGTDSAGAVTGSRAPAQSGAFNLDGVSLTSAKDFVALGKTNPPGSSTFNAGYYFVNTSDNHVDGVPERHYFIGDVRFPNRVNHFNAIKIKNNSTGSTIPIRWITSTDDNNYAYIGYFESLNRFDMSGVGIPSGVGLTVSSLGVVGTKNRIVETEHYGSVGMNAFETASSHFADIGSGTIGDDGIVTVFFDPIFEETIDMKAEYQVFLTRTSEAETTWVDKKNGYFIVHGDPGATFDWMIVGYQRDYITNRMEQMDPSEQYISDDPIAEEETDAIDAVQQMVAQYNEELEDIDND